MKKYKIVTNVTHTSSYFEINMLQKFKKKIEFSILIRSVYFESCFWLVFKEE